MAAQWIGHSMMTKTCDFGFQSGILEDGVLRPQWSRAFFL
jgi:hypothetical protein